MPKFRNNVLNAQDKKDLYRNLWIDFTSTTSFKSKANALNDASIERNLFIYLELDITTNPAPYSYTVCLQLMSD